MKLADEVKIALQTFIKMKESVCRHNNGPSDLAPMLHYKYPHLKGYRGILLAGGHPIQTVPSAWGHISKDGIPEFVMIMTEAYASATPLQEYKRGEMEKDFKNNPCSQVVEIINVHAIDMKTGEQFDGFVSFKYDDSGIPVFDEPSYSKCEGEALKANMPAIFTACRGATLMLNNKKAV